MSLLNHFFPSQTGTATQDNSTATELGNTVKPTYEVQETPEAFGLTVYLPGVAKDGLELTAEENQVRIVGRRQWKQPEGWASLYRETGNATFELVLTHDNAIDADKITAELRDGILHASLPKQEAVKPRKIAVN
jgi:HSP20 family molecular chaperone IbpA